MDVWGAILVLVRRFYLTVPIAAATLLGGYVYARTTPAEYHASASLLVLGPTAAAPTDKNAPPPPANPYATMNLTTLLTALQIDMTSAQVLGTISAAGGTTDFTMHVLNKSSIVGVTATSTDATQALRTSNQVLSLVQTDLLNRQKPYTTNRAYQVTAQVIGAPELAAPDTQARTRGEAIAIGVALVLTVLAVLVIDAILAARARERRRRQRLSGDGQSDDASEHRTPVVRS